VKLEESELPDYTLKPNDELFIKISSLDVGAANVFAGGSDQSAQNLISTPYGASLISYPIDKDGYLLFPLVGNIYVKGKTIPQVSMILRDSLYSILNQPIVSIKLINRYITVFGEVKNPGHFTFSQEKLTIFDALAFAGDITDYGNRNEVVLLRNENGENYRIGLDLTKTKILSSGYYYIRPNDIVYVKPLRNKFWGMRQFPFSILFSTITTGLLIYNIMK